MDGYTTKEILLAVKDKLCEHDRRLKELSNLTDYKNDKDVKRVNYVMSEYNVSEKPELYYIVSLNNKKINGRVKKTLEHMNLYLNTRESGLVLRDNNGRSYFLNKKYNIFIPDENQHEFGCISKELLDDEFAYEFLKSHYFYPAKKGLNQNMSVFNKELCIRGYIKDEPILFNYNPGERQAHLANYKGKDLSDSTLQELFNIVLDDYYFEGYRRDFIESSPNKNKEIEVPKFNDNTGVVDFKVEENEKGLRLIKK